MKKNILFSVILTATSLSGFAQIPAGYYDNATGYTGYALKTKLCNIITLGHVDHGYNGLYNGYPNTDVDRYYENDGTVLDIYSEKPSSVDAYTYSYTVPANRCGNYSTEGDCFNREHMMPQSLFNSASPMKNDIQFVVPTDGKVNGVRDNFPYGKVNNPTWTSTNGSKLGPNASAGYSGTVFEPIDEFKGDVARTLFYFVTRYQNSVPSFSSGNIMDGTATRGLLQWQVDLLLQWHQQDPVSQREKDRNNAAYNYQGNRNPYIDHPEYVDCIWGNTNCAPTSVATINTTNTYIDVYPNPAKDIVHLSITANATDALEMMVVQSVDGRVLWTKDVPKAQQYQGQIDMSTYPSGIYILKIKTEQGLAIKKLIKE
ncbi:endonuclease I [Taibaiella sp. KBW10]|uniref:endonuclease n=1 Tax=Taibaiella sp. KBW10 TaxID=2153357 RepID=UPI000F5B2DA4|nr:endonuclease [Taibaiella sp. KBW10]RQO32170.1 endonuclease I [Taibaiella sp. KBW10]